jgi:hypothetical protein
MTDRGRDPIYKWTLAEYALRTRVSPVAELVVEGDNDREFFGDLLQRYGIKQVGIIDASFIDVPTTTIHELGLAAGAKGSLLAAAYELVAGGVVSGSSRILIIVDRDYDGDIDARLSSVAAATDGHSLECYALSPLALDRFLSRSLGVSTAKPRQTAKVKSGRAGGDWYSRVLPACVELSAVRRTLRDVAPHVGLFASWQDYIKISADGFARVDGEVLLARVLAAAGESGDDGTKAALKGARTSSAADPFRYVRGRDYVAVLSKVLRSSWGRRVPSFSVSNVKNDVVGRWLIVAACAPEVDEQPLPQRIRKDFDKWAA